MTLEESTPSFGYWVRRQRLALDMTQADLAHRSGCARVTIRKIEADERRPSRQLAVLLAEHLAVPEEERAAFIEAARGNRSPDRLSLPQQPVFPLKAEPRSETDFKFSPRGSTPFVARTRELDFLDTHFQRVLVEGGRIVFVTGEAGNGKTTLLHEFALRSMASQPDLIVLQGNCNAFSGMGDPYLPFRDTLSALVSSPETRQGPAPLSLEHHRRLTTLQPHATELLANYGKHLARHFFPNQFRSLNQSIQSTPVEHEQLIVFDQYTQVLNALAQRHPILLLLDDLQWADSASLSLLFHLGMRLAYFRLLVVGAYRGSDIATGRRFPGTGYESQHPIFEMVNEMRRRYGDIQIELGDSEDPRGFVEAWLDTEPNRLGSDFRTALFHRTRGNPLFTIELLRAMQERGDIFRDKAGQWVAAPSLSWEKLPARVEAVIEQRVGRLDASTLEVLTVASAEGEVFTAQVVAQALNTNERDLIRQLETLHSVHRLVTEHGEVETPEGILAQFRFRHVLFQAFLYTRLSQAKRRHLHRQIAHALETLYGEAKREVVPQLAHHFRLAGAWQEALHYTRQAAVRAEAMHAYDEAIQELHHALDLIPQGSQLDTRAALLERLGDNYAHFGDRPRALSLYKRVLDHLHQMRDSDWVTQVRLHRKIGETTVYMTWYKDRQRFAQTGHNYLQAGLSLAQTQPPHLEFVHLLTVLANEAWYPRVVPDWNAAEQFARQAVEMAEQLDAPEALSAALDALGNVYGGRGLFQERLEVARKRLKLSQDARFHDARQHANILQQTGFALLQVGQYREALPYLYQAEEQSANEHILDQQYRALRHQATCWFRLDEWDKVLDIEARRQDLENRYPNFSELVGPT